MAQKHLREFVSNPRRALQACFWKIGLHYTDFGTPIRAGRARSRKAGAKTFLGGAKCESRAKIVEIHPLGFLKSLILMQFSDFF
jgi:hypothetical protein